MTAVLDCRVSASSVAGRYRLERPLGAGSAGTVWLARDDLLGRLVALKRIDRANPAGRAVQEARAVASLAHPAIVRVHDIVRDDDAKVDWVVMEALSGRCLADVIADGERIGSEEARYIAQAVLAALEATHEAGLLHRDVKPANIQLCADGRVVLLDFGLAAPPVPVEQAALVVGTLPYLAPEVLAGAPHSPASDLYALGMSLYAALTGRVPPTPTWALDHRPCAAPPIVPLPADTAPLDDVVHGLLATDPHTRLTARATRLLLRQTRRGPTR